MKLPAAIAAFAFLLAGCAANPPAPVASPPVAAPTEVQILAINDFHGNLEPPKFNIGATAPDGSHVQVPAGGVAHMATAAKTLRAGHPFSITVSAGDIIGATPLVSALYLDEPSIDAMNLVGVELNAVGNHEFDKGTSELKRMQAGGCERYTSRQPCALEPFRGASFPFLAANTITPDGTPLFPATAIRLFGPVRIGFIGMTLKETGSIVTPGGVAGLTFADEAATANALVPQLKAQGADAIVILLHQGGATSGGYNDKRCPDFTGDILPILAKLDPAVDLVVSGHTHRSYICEMPRQGAHPLLVTSAGSYGTLITDIRLTFSPDRHVIGERADNVIIQGEPYATGQGAVPLVQSFPVFAADPAVSALVSRYVDAAAPQANRIVGTLSGPVNRTMSPDRENTAGDFLSDAMLFGGRKAGAQIAFTNQGGIRADLIPAASGDVTYGQIFSVQPFGNDLVVLTLTGAQLKALLEQEFESGKNTPDKPTMLLPSQGLFYSYDSRRGSGQRIVEMRLNGKPIDPAAKYRIAIGSFLATGGDNFTVFKQGADVTDLGVDLDATEAYLKTNPAAPKLGRIKNLNPAPPPPAH
ncbi:MAG TPA: bifunctional metallophosphatase/5'-nucleotidase [Sphingomicrobium sp.]|nr:bifunctional metallophosphatase/5'-nucleotidase [Sphingomicrobium sp.]